MPELGTYGSMRGEAHKSLLYRDQISGMVDAPKDLENAIASGNGCLTIAVGHNVNDNLPHEHELATALAWAKQAGYPNIAATLQRVLTKLETRPK
jgi:hypothetical protein